MLYYNQGVNVMDAMVPTILGIGIISLVINLVLLGVGAYLVYLAIKALRKYINNNNNNNN